MNLEFDLHIRAKSAPGEVLVLLRFRARGREAANQPLLQFRLKPRHKVVGRFKGTLC